jgi:hypothetical protein
MDVDRMPAVMREIVAMLPPPGTKWPIEERIRWLQAFEAVSRLIFKDDAALTINAEERTCEETLGRLLRREARYSRNGYGLGRLWQRRWHAPDPCHLHLTQSGARRIPGCPTHRDQRAAP